MVDEIELQTLQMQVIVTVVDSTASHSARPADQHVVAAHGAHRAPINLIPWCRTLVALTRNHVFLVAWCGGRRLGYSLVKYKVFAPKVAAVLVCFEVAMDSPRQLTHILATFAFQKRTRFFAADAPSTIHQDFLSAKLIDVLRRILWPLRKVSCHRVRSTFEVAYCMFLVVPDVQHNIICRVLRLFKFFVKFGRFQMLSAGEFNWIGRWNMVHTSAYNFFAIFHNLVWKRLQGRCAGFPVDSCEAFVSLHLVNV